MGFFFWPVFNDMPTDSDIRKLRESQSEEALARASLEEALKRTTSNLEKRLEKIEESDREQALKLTKIDGNTEKLKWLDDPTKRLIAGAVVTIVTGLFTALTTAFTTWVAMKGGHP